MGMKENERRKGHGSSQMAAREQMLANALYGASPLTLVDVFFAVFSLFDLRTLSWNNPAHQFPWLKGG